MTNNHRNQKMIFIHSQHINHSIMNAIIQYFSVTALFNHLFLNLKNRDGFIQLIPIRF